MAGVGGGELSGLERSVMTATMDFVGALRQLGFRLPDKADADVAAAAARGPMEAALAFRGAVATYSEQRAKAASGAEDAAMPELPPVVRAIAALNSSSSSAVDACSALPGADQATLTALEAHLQKLTSALTQLVGYLKADADVVARQAAAAKEIARRRQAEKDDQEAFERRKAEEEAQRHAATRALEEQRAAFAAQRAAEQQRAADEQSAAAERQLAAAKQASAARAAAQAEFEAATAGTAGETPAAPAAAAAGAPPPAAAAVAAPAAAAAAKEDAPLTEAERQARAAAAAATLAGVESDPNRASTAFMISTNDLMTDLLTSLDSGAAAGAPAPEPAPAAGSGSGVVVKPALALDTADAPKQQQPAAAQPKAAAGGAAPGRLRDSAHSKIAGSVINLRPGAAHPKYGTSKPEAAAPAATAATAQSSGAGGGAVDELDEVLGWLDQKGASAAAGGEGGSGGAGGRSNRPAGAVSTALSHDVADQAAAAAAALKQQQQQQQPQPAAAADARPCNRHSMVLDTMLDDILSVVEPGQQDQGAAAAVPAAADAATAGLSSDDLLKDLMTSMGADTTPLGHNGRTASEQELDDFLGSLGAPAVATPAPAAAAPAAAAPAAAAPSGGKSAAELQRQLDTLQSKKDQAVASENFPLAASLKSKIDDVEAQLASAQQAEGGGAAGDADAAAQLDALRAQIAETKAQKDAAVEAEDFPTAQRLKIEIDELEALLSEGSELLGGGAGSGAAAAPTGDAAILAALRAGDSVAVEAAIRGQEALDVVLSLSEPGTGNSALYIALDGGHEGICNLLVDAGADPNQPNAIGDTPLHLGVRKRYSDDPAKQPMFDRIVKYFVEKGAGDLYAENDDGKTPIDEAQPSYKEELSAFLAGLHARFA